MRITVNVNGFGGWATVGHPRSSNTYLFDARKYDVWAKSLQAANEGGEEEEWISQMPDERRTLDALTFN